MANITKVPPEQWLEEARRALIKYGIAGVKVDRLAKSLKVTRGGFYHHFKNQQDLLDRLVQHWAKTNDMLPKTQGVSSPKDALDKLNEIVERLVLQEEYSPSFDMAIREWARVDQRVSKAVDKVDAQRLKRLSALFSALGCDKDEAEVRAKVFYFHQIGYYAMGHHEVDTRAERLRSAPIYLRILCGKRYLEAAEEESRKWA